MLISSMVGIDMRATMDMDATIKGFHLRHEVLVEILNEIININIDDDTKFKIISIKDIREQDEYNGYKVSLESSFDGIIVPIKIDITTGDVITPKEIKYSFELMFNNRSIEILAYNLETVISEKFEAIITRGTDNTRSRDFYDLYILFKFQSNNFNIELLKEAIVNKFKSRQTIQKLNDVKNIFDEIKASEKLKKLWITYTKNYSYAEEISYNDIMTNLENIVKMF